MKLRQDFVTNSSSSSYIVVANITYCDELLDYMKEEHGKHGVRLLDEYLMGAKALKDYLDECIGLDCIASSVLDRIDETDTTAKYLAASFISSVQLFFLDDCSQVVITSELSTNMNFN